MIYQMVIESSDPDRFLPGSWEFDSPSSDPADVWTRATKIAVRERVSVKRILDERGKEVWE